MLVFSLMRVFLVVLDSVGIGAAPDADAYGDTGTSTLAHTAAAMGGLRLPTLEEMGLGNIPPLTDKKPIQGVAPVKRPTAAYGAMQEVSRGKDTTTGHWEIAGLHLAQGLALFPPGPPSFPADLLDALQQHTGRGILGNKAASGTAIIEELGAKHIETGAWIVYTSADSVFQLAAHEDVVPLPELYDACKFIRARCNELAVGRVIARPFIGTPGAFTRTDNRRDFSLPLPEPSILVRLAQQGCRIITVGKLDDVFPDSQVHESLHSENNPDAMKALLDVARRPRHSTDTLIFANLIDFDMRYGHRRDPLGYGKALEDTDQFLARFRSLLRNDDLLILTADHGNDPTHSGTDHTREYVPLLLYGEGIQPANLGLRQGFYDIAQSLAAVLGAPVMPRGADFILPHYSAQPL